MGLDKKKLALPKLIPFWKEFCQKPASSVEKQKKEMGNSGHSALHKGKRNAKRARGGRRGRIKEI
jgi:hypothetical protein